MSMAEEYLLAIDQGTGSTKAMLVDRRGVEVATTQVAVGQSHPRPGWTEQDAKELWSSTQEAVRACVTDEVAGSVVGVALSVQRETVMLWDRETGEVVGPVLSWQDQRTVAGAEKLDRQGHGDYVRSTSGLPLDPMFSALKAQWLLDQHDPDRVHTDTGRWCLGTVDTWLLSRFGGTAVTEIGTASRTQLLDIATGDWDPTLLDIFGIPPACLPAVVPSIGPFPAVRDLAPVPDGVPVLAVMADSHAALFAHAGWRRGVVKATYGTGTSVMKVGTPAGGESGVCSTIAWQIDGIVHALEANIRSTGRTLTWLADLFSVDVDVLWAEAEHADADGVHVVPAFGGLGAPFWDRGATASITGFSLGTRRPQVARAAVEAIAHQVDDVLEAFGSVGGTIEQLLCDGGMSRSGTLMQLQADVSDVPVRVSATANLSAKGAACLAGVAAGWWDLSDLEALLDDRDRGGDTYLAPALGDSERAARRAGWAAAVARARSCVREQNLETTP